MITLDVTAASTGHRVVLLPGNLPASPILTGGQRPGPPLQARATQRRAAS